jgi:hypothetical protein
MVMRCFQ